MGRYRVFYFEDLDRGEVIIGCPVCKRIERNFIEPVAVILEKGNYEKFDGHLKEIKSLEELKENKELFEKILNKDDLVCILHQNKEGKHWEEDTEEFKEWNNKILNLANEDRLTDKDIEGLNKDNLIYQFWRRVRAYRFAVDYKSLWEEVGQDWENFKGNLKDKVDLKEIDKNVEILKLYLKKENWDEEENTYDFEQEDENNIYDFRQAKFPLFYNYWSLIKRENKILKTETNLNFWYKNEVLAFQSVAYFNGAKFESETYFSGTSFKSVAYFSGASFESEIDFTEASFENVATFRGTEFQNMAYFSGASFESEIDFSKTSFESETYFTEASFKKLAIFRGIEFKNAAYFSEASFESKTDFRKTSFESVATFRGTEFQSTAYFSEAKFQNKVFFIGATFQNVTSFRQATFQNVASFKQATFQNVADFSKASFEKEVYFRGCNIAGFVLDDINLQKGTYFEINNCNFIALKFANFINHTDNFFISNSGIDKEIETTFNNPEANLEIDNCTLNNMKFSNCDFSQAKRITIKNSFIENVTFNNVDWGKISENRINPDVLEEDPKSARDSYRQIKYALDKQTDHINANWFYALEMKAYERYLKTLSWKDHFQEKLVFSIHKFISEFGISWVRPLVLIVLSTIIMLGLGTKLFPTGEIENKTSTTIFGFVVDKFYYVAPLWNIDFWVIYIALATIGIYFYFYLIWKINEVKLEKKEIGYEDAGFTFKAFNINSYKILISLFFIALPIYLIGLLWLYSGNSLITAVLEFLDRFATTLNIFKVFSHFVGEDSSLHKLYSGYLFLYKIYAIFILVLIYQLILAIRRRVRR